MFGTYLRRELAGRRRQTIIIAIGMGLAIGLVILVNSVTAGVRSAQASVLESMYGIGTDIAVSQTAEPGAAGDRQFGFGAADGSTDTDAGTTTLAQSRLDVPRGSATFDASTLDTALAVDNVAGAAGTLSLQSTTFTGEMPDASQFTPGERPAGGAAAPSTGGADGAGGSSFGIDTFTVDGVAVDATSVGPLTATTLTDGRSFAASDAGTNVVLLDASYASTSELAVGDTLSLGGADFEVVGIVASTSADATTAADSYIPLDVAQSLSGLSDQLSNIYVQAATAGDVSQIQSDLAAALPDQTVNTQADLASSVSGSLSTASDLVGNLGLWLSALVLVAAFLLAILFTTSGVTRRTREFGTLKAIGWSNGRVVRQVAGESLVQGTIGGAVGIAIGLVGIAIVNAVAPTLSASTAATQNGQGGPGGFAGPGAIASTSDIVLNAPVTMSVIVLAVALAVLGGLVAGAIGGWRAARLRPAEALRSIA